MKKFHHQPRSYWQRRFGRGPQLGFALVVALLMMVMLSLVALAMLGLSSVVMRASTAEQAGTIARANARFALAQAIAELQRTMGPDQRVTASAAAIISQPAQPHLTGVWESWHWTPTLGAPAYSEKSSKFLRWLVSSVPKDAKNLDFPNKMPSNDTIDLVSDHKDSEGQSTRVQATKILVNSSDFRSKGAYAWAVFDESSKAAVDLGDSTSTIDATQEIASRTAPNRFRADALDLKKLDHLGKPHNFFSLETANIPGKPSHREEIRRRFHDLTTGSLGLLTNTASGGLKQDLSTLMSPATFNKNSYENDNLYDFTIYLTDGKSSTVGNQLLLQPGEVKVFSARVEKNWSWSLENANPYDPKAFFDWGQSRDFGNKDNRTQNSWGVEAMPGWDPRAGLQTDHMSYGGGVNAGRPANSIYDFERDGQGESPSRGYVSIRTTDQIQVQLRAQKTTDNTVDDVFRVDLLAAKNSDYGNFLGSQDLLRSYRFRFSSPTDEISADPKKPIIDRIYRVADTIQAWNDTTIGGKKLLAMLEMTARSTKDELDDSKSWAFNNPVVEGGEIHTNQVGLTNQSYDLRLIEMTGWTSFPTIEWDAADGKGTPGFGRGYFGASRTSSEGVTNIPMFRVPITPAASLGDWIPANLIAGSKLPRVVHAFGNSRAHPLIPCASVVHPNLSGNRALDHSYWINDALWDRYYFSSITDLPPLPWLSSQSRNWQEILQDLFEQRKSALNPRITTIRPNSQSKSLVYSLASLDEKERSKEISRHLGVLGPFNVNSTSVDAWRAVLSSLRDQTVTGWGKTKLEHTDQSPFARMSMPLAGPNQTSKDINLLGQIRWAGFRALNDTEISKLAKEIVKQIRERGKLDHAPPLTLGEFVNRRVAAASELHSLTGLLQTAIDQSGVNDEVHALDSKKIDAASLPASRKNGVSTPEAMDGFTGEGSPGVLTQGDLMMLLAPIATVRGDTFKIRAYGEARAADGKSILARTWCEAVVQRVPEFVNPTEAPSTSLNNLRSTANQRFGRQFHVVSFRWLNAMEY